MSVGGGGSSCCCMLLEIVLAVVVPPAGVFLRCGLFSLEFFVCLLLTFCGYVPGIVYAVYVIVAVDREPHHCPHLHFDCTTTTTAAGSPSASYVHGYS